MGRKYVVDTGFQSIGTAAQDLVEILCPADAVMIVHSVNIDQTSEYTAAEAEKLQITYKRARGSYTSGSGGGSVTPALLEYGDAAAGITAERNNTTQASAGSGGLDTLFTDVWDVLAGYDFTPIPELRLIFSPSQALVISVSATNDTITTARCRVIVEELGG
jgi:hypothetical protein